VENGTGAAIKGFAKEEANSGTVQQEIASEKEPIGTMEKGAGERLLWA